MKVLVINCGSSSLKYQFIDSENGNVIAKGICDRIGNEGSSIDYKKGSGDKVNTAAPMKDHKDAVSLVIKKLTEPENGVIKALDNISLEVDSGEILSVIGANGAGKTTTIRLLLGLLNCSIILE